MNSFRLCRESIREQHTSREVDRSTEAPADVCAEAALQELVAAWHGLTPKVRKKIIALMRGG